MKRTSRLGGILLGVVGGVVGYYVCDWMLNYGFYALILPGTLVGAGFGLLSRQKCVACGIACGVVGVALGIFTEWRLFPFIEDRSFAFFLTHLNQLRPVTLLLIGLGGVFSFWFGMGREPGSGTDTGGRPPTREHSETSTSEE